MNTEHLVTMANQIGAFFQSQGGREEAVAGIADHLKRFWEPRMLRAIGLYLAAGGEGLTENVAEAVRKVAPLAGAIAPAASDARNAAGGPIARTIHAQHRPSFPGAGFRRNQLSGSHRSSWLIGVAGKFVSS